MQHALCVFTPTYNRAYSLDTLYKSLIAQTSKDFYWLIVDDGSSDNTEELIRSFQNQGHIKIDYIKTENGGKQRAWNIGALQCKAQLFMCVDSDDYLTVDAVKTILDAWDACRASNTVLGVATPRMPKNNNFPSRQSAKLSQIYSEYGYKGETCIATRTSTIKQHPFILADSEKFIPELYVFDQIDKLGYHYTVNKVICRGEYLEDGYSAHYGRLLVNNPICYSTYKLQCARYATSTLSVARETFLYLAWQKIAKKSIIQAAAKAPRKVLAGILAPLAFTAAPLLKRYVARS